MTLWSPFVGLFVLIVCIIGLGDRGGWPRPAIAFIVVAICWIIWISGLVLGITALRRGKTEGRTGAAGRAVVGMALDLLFLGLTILGTVSVMRMDAEIRGMVDKTAETEAGKLRAKFGDGEVLQKKLVSSADRDFSASVLELQKKYQTSAAGLTNPPVLDMALVKNKGDLRSREGVIGDFITASEELRDFCADAPDTYRQELLKHKLTSEAREASLKKFTESLRGMNPTIVALREADVRRGKAMLKLITFLEVNWGKWVYKPETDRLQFQGTKLSEDYHHANQELKDASAKTMRLQAELKKLSSTNN